MNLLDDAAEWLIGQLEDNCSRSIVYRRQGLESDPLSGTCTLQQYTVIDDDTGVQSVVQMFDWTLRRAALILGGEIIEPRPGDRLVAVIGACTFEYEVAPVGNRPCAEWSEAGGTSWKIHSVKVE